MTRAARTTALVVAGAVAGCSPIPPHLDSGSSARATPVFNALWNDSGSNGAIGLWIYSGQGSCPTIRQAVGSPLVFAPKSMRAGTSIDELAVAQMDYCFAITNNRPLARCKSGTVSLTYDAATSEYSGQYALVLTHGDVKQGAFRAQYCPKGE